MQPEPLRYRLLSLLHAHIVAGLLGNLIGCKPSASTDDYLLRFTHPVSDDCGYRNRQGDTIIQPGIYPVCFTDTFRTYALVAHARRGLVAIDRKQTVLYDLFPFDNGPDAPANGRFRIVADGKIGFADAATGNIVIAPQFACAYPFENGRAKVSTNCQTQSDGEHRTWHSNDWYFIDPTGKRIGPAD